MNIQVRFFAIFRERIGCEEIELPLPEGATARDALTSLGLEYPCILQLEGKFQIAINRHMAPFETVLSGGDELALIPPVAGGEDIKKQHIRVLDTDLSLDRCIDAVSHERVGGIATFTGVVRRQSRGKTVERLHYEAYAEMAEEVMEVINDEIRAEIPECQIAVEHRVGVLSVGEKAVVIAASAPHRDEAFRACRQMIDKLKERVPIWKKEVSDDGAEWIGLGP